MTVSIANMENDIATMTVRIHTMELESDMEVLERGRRVLNIWHWYIPAITIDQWVRRVAMASGQRLDWFYCRGRVVVKALGNIRKVEKAIERLLPKLWVIALEKFSRQRSLGHNVRR